MKLEPVHACPVCESNGAVELEGCRDFLFDFPETWVYRRCLQCASLWLDPRPTREMIPSLYRPGYVTHGEMAAPLRMRGLRASMKRAILERAYGYAGLSDQASSRMGAVLGKSLSYIPKISGRAGFTVRYLPSRTQGSLLDVGSGNGEFLMLMNELGWQTTGLEPDPQAACAAESAGLRIMNCSVEDTLLEDGAYDAVTLHHVLEHLGEPQAVLSKLARALKPGGVLVSVSPNPVGALARRFRQAWRGLEPPRHLVLPSPDGYGRMLKSLGFQTQVSTIMRTAFWMYQDSMSIRLEGRVGHYRKRFLPKIISSIGSNFVLPLFPSSGEEVVCIATKN
jgi:2-polyprenyl-3-methyl-5-hydroxy-6-metoxy-1,4-benzoquinol methylase